MQPVKVNCDIGSGVTLVYTTDDIDIPADKMGRRSSNEPNEKSP